MTGHSLDRNGSAGTQRPELLLACFGPIGHGIAGTARQIGAAARSLGFDGPIVDDEDPLALGRLPQQLPPGVRVVQVHVNDWLFGGPEGGSALLSGIADRLHRNGVALVLTLHDLPWTTGGTGLERRRAAAYRRLADSADALILSSRHELALLRSAVGQALPPVQVVPLPVVTASGTAPVPRGRPPVIGVFGYLYPGKGHAELIQELTDMPTGTTVLALGRASDRHVDLLSDLDRRAEQAGINFRCTGFVPDEQVAARLRDVDVPVAPHLQVSASGSINSWLGAGRRPLVPDGTYVRELEERMPGSVLRYRPGTVRQAVLDALDDPGTTVLADGLVVGPGPQEVAERYLSFCLSVGR